MIVENYNDPWDYLVAKQLFKPHDFDYLKIKVAELLGGLEIQDRQNEYVFPNFDEKTHALFWDNTLQLAHAGGRVREKFTDNVPMVEIVSFTTKSVEQMRTNNSRWKSFVFTMNFSEIGDGIELYSSRTQEEPDQKIDWVANCGVGYVRHSDRFHRVSNTREFGRTIAVNMCLVNRYYLQNIYRHYLIRTGQESFFVDEEEFVDTP